MTIKRGSYNQNEVSIRSHVSLKVDRYSVIKQNPKFCKYKNIILSNKGNIKKIL